MNRTMRVLVALVIGFASISANATLTLRTAFQNSALSVDGFGGTSGTLRADIPAGATVQQAFLYSTDIFGSGLTGNITFQGNVLSGGAGALLAPNTNPANTEVFDVTGIVKPLIEGGPGGVVNFTISEQGNRDGEVLVVIYSHPTTAGSTAIVLDGELARAGDSTTLNFAAPYSGGDAIMSLASSFSCCGADSGTSATPQGQVTVVDVVTSSSPLRRLTQCAGGNDDGGNVGGNGQLLTVGGIGDSAANPLPNCTGGAGDDELYNLALGNAANPAPFLAVGTTSITFNTVNPSNDDNVFGLFFTTAFTITQVNDVVLPPTGPTGVPVPGTVFLLSLGLFALAAARKSSRA
jgi:hypothetical protein